MPTMVVDGIPTRYERDGTGPALLMFAPGGFSATVENWQTHGFYRQLNLVSHLSREFTCLRFDRRESGRSGGRVERITWQDYADQGKGLLDQLGVERAVVMGACVGASIAAQLAASNPERIAGMVLFAPAGGVKYRMAQHQRFAAHEVFVRSHGLPAVVELARGGTDGFSQDPRVGPWAAVLRSDATFADSYAAWDTERYLTVLRGMARVLFDRDTVPGPEPEDLLALSVPSLVIPGHDSSHAPSAAHYLAECLPAAQLWDVPVAQQTEQRVAEVLLEFLHRVSADLTPVPG